MALEIDPKLVDELPATVKNTLGKMSSQQQSVFEEEYKRKRKDKVLYIFLAIFFPIQHFLMGMVGLGIIFWLTTGGFLIWYIIEWFIAPKRVREWNHRVASEIMRDMKIMGT